MATLNETNEYEQPLKAVLPILAGATFVSYILIYLLHYMGTSNEFNQLAIRVLNVSAIMGTITLPLMWLSVKNVHVTELNKPLLIITVIKALVVMGIFISFVNLFVLTK